MRITQGMLSQQLLTDIEANSQRVSQLQNEVATGKQINSPADNPVGAGLTMRYNADLSYYQQYSTNAKTAQQWLSYTDTMMSQANSVMQRARDLANQGANGTLAPADRQALASEVDQLYQQLVTIGNTQYTGQYIFAGQNTNQAPYPTSGAENAKVDTGSILYDVGDGVHLAVNTSGQNFFGTPANSGSGTGGTGGSSSSTSDNAFAVLQNLQTALQNNNINGIENALGQIDKRMSAMHAAQADVGAKENRATMVQQRLSSLTQNFQTLLSNTQDANMAQVISDFQQAQNVQQASLQVGAMVIQPTLLNFLK